MKKRREKGRAAFYTRDSGGKHENTPGEYVAWAKRTADDIGLQFNGTPDAIEAMIRDGRSACGDLFLDFGVPGNVLSRQGLDALINSVMSDHNLSHVLIPRRNRLARPDHPMDGVKLEDTLRREGVTLVFMDRILLPLRRGKRPDVAELIAATIDYDRSAEDRRELAQKTIYSQLRLSKHGYSTGGRPPYGFRRWLVKEDGTPVRELSEGEHVKMRGHHVVWLPGGEAEWCIIRRILKMLETVPASQVARTLTAEQVPSPDHGRCRTDNGVRHQTSGVWHQSTIISIARNPLLLAVVEHGRRSMGDQLRFTPEGPRELEETDFRADNDRPKVVSNPEKDRITAPATFDALVAPEHHQKLLNKLDERAGTQRGKARSRDPKRNPLGCRVFDMSCGWPMYRTPYGGSFRYACGLYQQSHAAQCNHNQVDGPTATRFVLSCVRQHLLLPTHLQKLEARIREQAATDSQDDQRQRELSRKRAELQEVEKQRDQAAANMARAQTDDQYQALATVFEQLAQKAKSIQTEIADAESQLDGTNDAGSAVEIAMKIVQQLPELARAAEDLGIARQIFDLINARLFLGFRQLKVKKRTLNRISDGVVTFGSAPPPIELYEGPTARGKINAPTASVAAGNGGQVSPSAPERCLGPGREGKSLGNVNRGERIRTSDFLLPNPEVEVEDHRKLRRNNVVMPFHLFHNLPSTHYLHLV